MLKSKDKEKILEVIKKGTEARAIYQANALNLRSKGLTMIEVKDFLEITSRTVFNIERNYEDGGLNKVLDDDPPPSNSYKI